MGHFHFDLCQFLAMKFKRLLKLSRCQWAAQEKSQWDKDDFIRKSQGDAEFSSLKPTALKPTVGPVPDFRPRLREPQIHQTAQQSLSVLVPAVENSQTRQIVQNPDQTCQIGQIGQIHDLICQTCNIGPILGPMSDLGGLVLTFFYPGKQREKEVVEIF